MTATDAGFLYLERPEAPLHVGCVVIVDGSVSVRELSSLLQRCVDRIQRYRERPVPVPFSLAHPTWELDPRFDLANHVHRWRVRAPGREHALTERVARLLEVPLDRSRPLWEVHLLEGLPEGRSAVFCKVHHCMIDGVAGVGLLEALLGQPLPTGVAPLRLPDPLLPAGVARSLGAVSNCVRSQAGVAVRALWTLLRPEARRSAGTALRELVGWTLSVTSEGVAKLPWNAPLGPHRALAFSRLPMQGIRRIRQAHGGTVNDVVVSVLAGGLHRYLRSLGGVGLDAPVRALVPVSLRAPGTSAALGNHLSALLVPLAVRAADERHRLAESRAILDSLKAGSGRRRVAALLDAVTLLPPAVVAQLARRIRLPLPANLIATNVPGPRESRRLGPHRVAAIYPLVPLFHGLGLGLAAFSYDGWLHLGLNAESELVPELDKLRVGIEEAFESLLDH